MPRADARVTPAVVVAHLGRSAREAVHSVIKSSIEILTEAAASVVGRACLYSGAVVLGAVAGISVAMHEFVSPLRALSSLFFIILGSLISLPTAVLAAAIIAGFVIYLRCETKPWLATVPFALMALLSYWLAKWFVVAAG